MSLVNVVIADLRGGMNSGDSPLLLPDNQCTYALNVDWRDALVARKRYGASTIGVTGGTAFTGQINTLLRFVPGADESAAELYAFDSASPTLVKRLAGGTSWADVTLSDNVSASPIEIYGATLNGKLYIAYNSGVDRLHAYDPGLSSPRLRRVGLATSSAPTVADTGAGAYPATLRYYKQDTIQLTGSVVTRRSELSASVSFTPSGGGTAARVTRGTFPGEQETHWRVWGSADNTTYYLLSGNIAIGTTTYDDSATVSAYSTGTPQEVTGTFLNWTSVKYLITDGNRILGGAGWATGSKQSRVYFSPVLGSLDQGDDERVVGTTSQKNFVDLNENDGGGITGMGVFGTTPIVFKYRQVYQLVPTGDVTAPYLPKRISNSVGCIAAKTITSGEDEQGRECIYWLSARGPYRYGANGLQYLGRDLEDIWTLGTSRLGLSAANSVAHSQYYADVHQWWVWASIFGNDDPQHKLVFDSRLGRPNERNEVRGGWSRHVSGTGATGSCDARCSVLFGTSIGASMSKILKPYVGLRTGTVILKCDDTTTPLDNGVAYQAYITTKPVAPLAVLGRNYGVGPLTVVGQGAPAAAGPPTFVTPTITATLLKELAGAVTATTDLTAVGGHRIFQKVEGVDFSGAGMMQITIGDGSELATSWFLDAIVAPVDVQEPR